MKRKLRRVCPPHGSRVNLGSRRRVLSDRILSTRLACSNDGRVDARFDIGAKDLGTLSAFYFYAYVAMQIPTGVLVDSWGSRKLLLVGSVLAAAGTFLFGLHRATHWRVWAARSSERPLRLDGLFC